MNNNSCNNCDTCNTCNACDTSKRIMTFDDFSRENPHLAKYTREIRPNELFPIYPEEEFPEYFMEHKKGGHFIDIVNYGAQDAFLCGHADLPNEKLGNIRNRGIVKRNCEKHENFKIDIDIDMDIGNASCDK